MYLWYIDDPGGNKFQNSYFKSIALNLGVIWKGICMPNIKSHALVWLKKSMSLFFATHRHADPKFHLGT